MLSIQSLSSLISFLINSYNALLSILLFFYLLLRCFSLHYARRTQLSSALLFVVSSYKIMSKIASPLRPLSRTRDSGEYRIRTDDPLLAKQVL